MEAASTLLQAVRGSVCCRCLQRASLLSSSRIAPPRSLSTTTTRALSSSAPRTQVVSYDADPTERPRWQTTPSAMVAPVRTRPRPKGPEHKVNNDPRKLDRFYADFLGGRDSQLQLSDEVRWLAVTHKSFDHGKRGFNDRLAFLGKRIVDLQTSLALVSAPQMEVSQTETDAYKRPIFRHPRLSGLEQVTEENRSHILDKKRLARLAEGHGMQDIVRWKPKKTDDLYGSGLHSVLAQTVYAIVGAISLEKGGLVATNVVKERILRPLGL